MAMESARLGCTLDSIETFRSKISELCNQQKLLCLSSIRNLVALADLPFAAPSSKRRKGSTHCLSAVGKEVRFQTIGNENYSTGGHQSYFTGGKGTHAAQQSLKVLDSVILLQKFDGRAAGEDAILHQTEQPLTHEDVILHQRDAEQPLPQEDVILHQSDAEQPLTDEDVVLHQRDPEQPLTQEVVILHQREALNSLERKVDAPASLHTTVREDLEPSPLIVETSSSAKTNATSSRGRSSKRRVESNNRAGAVATARVTRAKAKIIENGPGNTSPARKRPSPKLDAAKSNFVSAAAAAEEEQLAGQMAEQASESPRLCDEGIAKDLYGEKQATMSPVICDGGASDDVARRMDWEKGKSRKLCEEPSAISLSPGGMDQGLTEPRIIVDLILDLQCSSKEPDREEAVQLAMAEKSAGSNQDFHSPEVNDERETFAMECTPVALDGNLLEVRNPGMRLDRDKETPWSPLDHGEAQGSTAPALERRKFIEVGEGEVLIDLLAAKAVLNYGRAGSLAREDKESRKNSPLVKGGNPSGLRVLSCSTKSSLSKGKNDESGRKGSLDTDQKDVLISTARYHQDGEFCGLGTIPDHLSDKPLRSPNSIYQKEDSLLPTTAPQGCRRKTDTTHGEVVVLTSCELEVKETNDPVENSAECGVDAFSTPVPGHPGESAAEVCRTEVNLPISRAYFAHNFTNVGCRSESRVLRLLSRKHAERFGLQESFAGDAENVTAKMSLVGWSGGCGVRGKVASQLRSNFELEPPDSVTIRHPRKRSRGWCSVRSELESKYGDDDKVSGQGTSNLERRYGGDDKLSNGEAHKLESTCGDYKVSEQEAAKVEEAQTREDEVLSDSGEVFHSLPKHTKYCNPSLSTMMTDYVVAENLSSNHVESLDGLDSQSFLLLPSLEQAPAVQGSRSLALSEPSAIFKSRLPIRRCRSLTVSEPASQSRMSTRGCRSVTLAAAAASRMPDNQFDENRLDLRMRVIQSARNSLPNRKDNAVENPPEVSEQMEDRERREKLTNGEQSNARCDMEMEQGEVERFEEEANGMQRQSAQARKVASENVQHMDSSVQASKAALSDISNSKDLLSRDAKLKRAIAAKQRIEQEKMKKHQEDFRRKDEEMKKKEAKLMANKQKKVEQEKREREEKKKRQEESLKQRKEQENKLRAELAEKEQRRRALEDAERERKAMEEENKRLCRAERDRKRKQRQQDELEAKSVRQTEREAEPKRRGAAVVSSKGIEEKEHQKTAEGASSTFSGPWQKKLSSVSGDSVAQDPLALGTFLSFGPAVRVPIMRDGQSHMAVTPALHKKGNLLFLNAGHTPAVCKFSADIMSQSLGVAADLKKGDSGRVCLESSSRGAVTKGVPEVTSYEISPYRELSDDEDVQELKRLAKPIPLWARKENLKPLLLKQFVHDPDEIFSGCKSCSLKDIFGTNGSKKIQDFGKRSGSGDWVKDRVSWKEELQYKINMGYMQKNI